MIKIKKKNKSADAHEQQTPYAGTFKGTVVPTAPHLLVSGPTGRGKSLRVLVPGALMWRGPRVLVTALYLCTGMHSRSIAAFTVINTQCLSLS